MMNRYASILLFIFLSIAGVRAEHFSGGTVSTRCVGGNFHEITLQLFRNCSGSELLPQTLAFSNDCGVFFEQTGLLPVSVEEVSPLCAEDLPNSTCNGGTLVGYDLTTFRVTVYLSPCDSWRISWSTCCRNSSLNVDGTPGMWIETLLNNAGGLCNAAPEFVNNTIPLVCLGQPVSYDGSATDADGNALRYHLIDARYGTPDPVSVQYSGSYSGAAPFTGMAIDSLTGRITFLPTLTGAVITVIEVGEYNGAGDLIGNVMRDFLFVVSACDNEVPSISSGTFTAVTGPATITDERSLLVCSEGTFCASLAFADADLDQALTITTNLADNLPGATIELSGTNPVSAVICWNAAGIPPGDIQFTVTATDDACPVVGIQQFAYTIVVGSSPSAGSDGLVAYCGAAEAFTLTDSLTGDPATDGTWSDPDGDLFDGTFVPGTDAPGEYVYTTSGTSGCTDSATLTLEILAPTDPACIALAIMDLGREGMTLRRDASGTGRMLLSTTRSGNYDLTVVSGDGRLFHAERANLAAGVPFVLELGDAAAGTYVLRIIDTKGQATWSERMVLP